MLSISIASETALALFGASFGAIFVITTLVFSSLRIPNQKMLEPQKTIIELACMILLGLSALVVNAALWLLLIQRLKFTIE